MKKLGTLIKLSDGRVGRIVYNGLDGQGINLSRIPLSQEDKERLLNSCPLFDGLKQENWPEHLFPKVMLREKYNTSLECFNDFSVISE